MHLADRPEYRERLAGRTVLITGGAGGIGLAAAECWLRMGAGVAILDADAGRIAEAKDRLFPLDQGARSLFLRCDVGRPSQLRGSLRRARRKFGAIDIVFSNAARISVGSALELSLRDWERGYRVNFLGPLLLARLVLPEMRSRGKGILVFVSSSGTVPFLGAYEIFKTAQGDLAELLSGEEEESGIRIFTISPGLVKTQTARGAISRVAELMGMGEEAFYADNAAHLLGEEEAGLGFALSVLAAETYQGKEIGAIQVLRDFGIDEGGNEGPEAETGPLGDAEARLLSAIREDFRRQRAGWMARSLFERKWLLRDFEKTAGISLDALGSGLDRLEEAGRAAEAFPRAEARGLLGRLGVYYAHQRELLKGFERDPAKFAEFEAALLGFEGAIKELWRLLDSAAKLIETSPNQSRAKRGR